MNKHFFSICVALCLLSNLSMAVDVSTGTEFISALNNFQSPINIKSDITISGNQWVSLWQKKTIEINGNGHKLTMDEATFSGYSILNFHDVTFDIAKFNLQDDGIQLNFLENTNVEVSNEVNLKGATIYVENQFYTKIMTINDGWESKLKIGEAGVVNVYENFTGTGDCTFSIEGTGKIIVGGNVDFSQTHFSIDGGALMFVDGDFNLNSTNSEYSVLNGQLYVQGDFGINWVNNNNNAEFVGSGDIYVYSNIKCQNNNSVSGQACINQLGKHFSVNQIHNGNGSYPNNHVPLPIVLSSFNAYCQQNDVNVYWTTESEQNNDYFTIYRSADGEIFEPIGNVEGAGNSTITLNYSFVDYYPLEGVSYYLLQQTDYDGTSKYSKKVAVSRTLSAEACQIKVFPNPYQGDGLTIDLGGNINSDVQVQVVDAMGKVVSSVSCKSTGSAVRINPSLNAGVYMVKVSAAGQTSTQKLVVE